MPGRRKPDPPVMLRFSAKVTYFARDYAVVYVPAKIRRALSLQPGDICNITIEKTGFNIEVKKKRFVSKFAKQAINSLHI